MSPDGGSWSRPPGSTENPGVGGSIPSLPTTSLLMISAGCAALSPLTTSSARQPLSLISPTAGTHGLPRIYRQAAGDGTTAPEPATREAIHEGGVTAPRRMPYDTACDRSRSVSGST